LTTQNPPSEYQNRLPSGPSLTIPRVTMDTEPPHMVPNTTERVVWTVRGVGGSSGLV
jgi:hypothetical protein